MVGTADSVIIREVAIGMIIQLHVSQACAASLSDEEFYTVWSALTNTS